VRDLNDWRREIDALDRELVELLNRRAKCVLELAPLKRESKINVLDPVREKAVHDNLRAANAGPLPQEAVSEIFDCVMKAMRDLQEASVGLE
jgi:chorismate mutase